MAGGHFRDKMITRTGSGPGQDWPLPRGAGASFSFAHSQASGRSLGLDPVGGFPGIRSPSSPPVFRRDLEEPPPSGRWGARTVPAGSALSQFMKHFTDMISCC